MSIDFRRERILIWGKTYPELSWHHRETVCTGGCASNGRPIRIYPVPLRYLPAQRQYRLYDWIEIPVARSTSDVRPESHKVRANELKVIGHVDTKHGWLERRRIIFQDRSWHFECLEDLKEEQRRSGKSLGLVTVGAIERVWMTERSENERLAHERKLYELSSIIDAFDTAVSQKDLEFFPYRIRVAWRCKRLDGEKRCPGHTAAVLDWGLGELARREGIGKALQKMESLADLKRYDLRFFVGNFKAHPRNFGIVGVWYPLRADVEKYPIQEQLFT